MTIKQKQCLLCYLGYYTGAIDGIWGAQSASATRQFQQSCGLAVDGIFGAETQTKILAAIAGGGEERNWWQEIRYFRRAEFACKCGNCGGYPAEPEETLVRAADMVRSHFGAAAIVSSGVRCPAHNAKVGGVANSRHLTGKAMDFCISGKSAKEVLAQVQQMPQIRYAYAIDSRYVHMDI